MTGQQGHQDGHANPDNWSTKNALDIHRTRAEAPSPLAREEDDLVPSGYRESLTRGALSQECAQAQDRGLCGRAGSNGPGQKAPL